MTHRLLAVLVALSGFVAFPGGVHAQGVRSGRIEGTVTDSVHARPLAGVRVVAVGVGAPSSLRGAVTSDSAGRYRIDSLAPGRYMVGFESPLLDSLEIVLPPRAVEVESGLAETVDLAMPPAKKLRAALCPGVQLAEGDGLVYGRVVSAESESPLPDAAVALQWRVLAVWDSGGSNVLRTVSSAKAMSDVTDAGGWYRVCGVPTGTWVSMQIQHEGRVGPVLRTLVDSTLGIAIRHISYSSVTARDSGDFATGAPATPFSGTATLTGVVRGPGGNPIPSAEVHVLGARGTATTDDQGTYTLTGLPAGTHEMEARRIGYSLAEAWVELRSGTTMRSDIRLERIVSLDSVRIVATRTRYPEFAEHRRMSIDGRFLGPEDIQRRRVGRTSDIIRALGGFIVENRGGRTRIISVGFGPATRPCYANVAIDGFRGFSDDPDQFSVDDVPPNLVGAIEAYRSGGPPEYAANPGCGTIVIWTKR